jgi:hypothetical protein
MLCAPRQGFAVCAAMALTAAVSTTAHAQSTQPTSTSVPGEAPARAPVAFGEPKRKMDMEANFRFRSMSIPSSILDIWFFDSDDPGANPFDRPQVRTYAFGVEYVLKPKPMNWIFYYEYVASGMKEGYWDDAEQPPNHDDGDWLKPNGFGMHIVGANYAHELDVTPTDRAVWLSMLFSAGLGVGVVSGELETWHPGTNDGIRNDCLRDAPAYERKDECPSDGQVNLPGLLPILDLTMSARVNFDNRATARLDVGLHNLFYIGGAVGTVF